MELESKVTQLQEEVDKGGGGAAKKQNGENIPRPPCKYTLSGHRNNINSVRYTPHMAHTTRHTTHTHTHTTRYAHTRAWATDSTRCSTFWRRHPRTPRSCYGTTKRASSIERSRATRWRFRTSPSTRRANFWVRPLLPHSLVACLRSCRSLSSLIV